MRGRAAGLGARISSMVGLFAVIIGGGCFIEKGVVVLGDLRLDKGDFLLGQPVSLIKLGVRPLLVQWKIWHKSVDGLECILRRLAERYEEANETSAEILRIVRR